MTSRRLASSRALAVLALLASAVGAHAANASVTIVPTTQCRDTSCLVQLIFNTNAARTATVTAGGISTKVSVRKGSSRRLARVRGLSSQFRVKVAFEGRTSARIVNRVGFPINRTAQSCAVLAPTTAVLSVGPTSAQTAAFTVPSRGTVRMAVIFVDFSDAPATQTTDSVVTGWLTPGVRWIGTSSYGRVAISLSPRSSGWIRMPKPSTAYGMNDGTTYLEHKAYIADAIAAADPVMNFAGADSIYVVAANGVAIPQSPTFHSPPGTFTADGQPLGSAVTFGVDAYTWGRTILPHETGHLFGLPDLYGYFGPNQFRFTGVWDHMGDVFDPTDLTAWQRRKLDWLIPEQMLCGHRLGASWAMLSPLGVAGGAKAIFIRTGTYTGLVVENRQRVGNDRSICKPGALVYTVDSRIDSGNGPIKVVGGDATGPGCGYGNRSDATLGVGQSVTRGKVTVRVIGSQNGKLEVSVTGV